MTLVVIQSSWTKTSEYYESEPNQSFHDDAFEREVSSFYDDNFPSALGYEALTHMVKVYHKYTSGNLRMQRWVAELHRRHDLTEIWRAGGGLILFDSLDEILDNVDIIDRMIDDAPNAYVASACAVQTGAMEVDGSEEADIAESGEPDEQEDENEEIEESGEEATTIPALPPAREHGLTKRFDIDEKSREYAYQCDRCKHVVRTRSRLVQHMLERSNRLGFEIVQVLKDEMVWRAVDSAGNAYSGAIEAANPEGRLQVYEKSHMKIPHPCDNVVKMSLVQPQAGKKSTANGTQLNEAVLTKQIQRHLRLAGENLELLKALR